MMNQLAIGPGAPLGRRTAFLEAAGRLTRRHADALVIGTVTFMLGLAYLAAFLIRYEFHLPKAASTLMLRSLPLVLVAQGVLFHVCGVFRILWAYVGIRDLFRILGAGLLSTMLLLGLDLLVAPEDVVPRSVLVLDGLFAFVGVGGLYAGLRFVREAGARPAARREQAEPVLIIGAGDSGETLLREIERGKGRKIRVAGFLDDAADKQGHRLRGVPVLGWTDEARFWADQLGVRTVFIAIPNAEGAALRKIAGPLREAGLAVKVLPPVGRLSTDENFLHQLQDLSMEDLLRRKPIRLDHVGITNFVRGKTVLVTGAGGSIGSELCRQLLRLQPARLVALDCAESPLHDIMLELQDGPAVAELADITDPLRVKAVFEKHSPQVVFHAAALKHVPMCESHTRDAVRVNIGGTSIVGQAAADAGVSTFIMISTDKAVRPTSLMGATKRVAELVVQDLNRGRRGTRFSAVRFGNVLGSNGSVLRIFKSQLARGMPLTVTHPDMRRYFMTIPEAVQLVLQAAVLGRGEEVFELDMGEPVRIVDLAEDLIRLSGASSSDVRIEFTGLRPGEKLFEELYLDSELIEPTAHPQVFCLRRGGPETGPDPAVKLCRDRLDADVDRNDPVFHRVNELLRRISESDGVPLASAS